MLNILYHHSLCFIAFIFHSGGNGGGGGGGNGG